jgi:spectinomycin phosphotransferase
LESTYAAAAGLAEQGLDFVLAGVATRSGRMTVPFADGALSATPWRDGTGGDGTFTPEQLATTVTYVDRLHTVAPPARLRTWGPLVGPDLAEDLARRTSHPWTAGPHGEAARTVVRERLDDLAAWTAEYHLLAAATDPATWVATHGEPDTGNQLATDDGVLLVDWESLMLAPAERDLRTVVDAGHEHPRADPAMLALFDLEWRLDEIAQYAAWFEQPHGDSANDRTALGGLRHELSRP